jgi:NAD(P)-dependent dehydrogenase (short-subunit alcohol dehydrogenase family)
MARIFITGSADGLGQLAAKALVEQRHRVVLHARNDDRAGDAMKHVSGAEAVLTGDLSNIQETKALAEKVNAFGKFDAVIHNAGVYRGAGTQIFAVNTVAPYVLTALIKKPQRLIYLSSGLHMQGQPNLEYFSHQTEGISYSDSKLHDVMLAFAVARRWPETYSNAVNPGWVPTRMGGKGAPDELQKGYETQAWLAVSSDAEALVRGKYFFHQQEKRHNPVADDETLQEKFLAKLQEVTGVVLD